MKNILGHKSWNRGEIIDMLKRTRTFTMCSLPHYRYARVQDICSQLRKRGLIRKSGSTETGINFVPTSLFDIWADEYEACETHLGLWEWFKEYRRLGRDLV